MRVSEMKILAIESSCDETAAAVVEDGRRVISSVIASQVKEHILYGGVVPEIASRRHAEAISGVVGEALDRAEMKIGDVDAIAVTYRRAVSRRKFCKGTRVFREQTARARASSALAYRGELYNPPRP